MSSTSSGIGMPLMALNDTKAGMEGLDKAKIEAIIEENSKGSKFYQAKLKSQERITEQVTKMKTSWENLTQHKIDKALAEADRLVEDLRSSRDLSRTIVHIDMDAFYAAVEMRDDPALKIKPMAVGGMGMLSTSNYLARKFGVRAGMPGFIAKKLCPDLVIVGPNFKKYQEVSTIVRSVFQEYDPNFCPMSLDEAYLDLTDTLTALAGTSDCQTMVEEIRHKIEDRTQLTASAGIAANTMLAKVCSDQKKPNGQFYLAPDVETISRFVDRLSIRKVSGIGNVTEQMLNSIGVNTCRDLYERRALLKLLFSDISFQSFMRIALGLGSNHPSDWNEQGRKSMSTETTFRDTSSVEVLHGICTTICQELAQDLQKHSLQGRSVTLKIKTHKFQIKTKVRHLPEPTSQANLIEKAAQKILKQFEDNAEEKPLTLRLMGVRMSGWDGNSGQQSISSFLNAKRDSSKSFECPICLKDIQASSEIQFNHHLDSCLLQGHKENDLERARESGQSQTTLRTPIQSTSNIAEGQVIKEGGVVDKDKQCDNDALPRDQTVATVSSADVSCPICARSLPNADRVVNAHVDECLNRSEITHMVQRKRPRAPSEKPHQGIRKYFRSK